VPALLGNPQRIRPLAAREVWRASVSYNTAWALHHKLRPVMLERNQEKPLDRRIEMAAARAAVHEEEHQENHRADRALARARELAVQAEEGERLE
jgi:hypothetical protein